MSEINQTYIRILADSLQKKIIVLKQLDQLTREQETLLLEPAFDEEQFDVRMGEKEKVLNQLEQLDQGFENIYRLVGKELSQNPQQYKNEVMEIQKYIQVITKFSVDLQALEERNKNRLQVYLSTKRKEFREIRKNSQSAASYYKNLASQHQEGQSYFLDRKN